MAISKAFDPLVPIGLALGFLAIQALNVVRIISLFYLLQWNPVWFEWAHLYLWQALIMLDGPSSTCCGCGRCRGR